MSEAVSEPDRPLYDKIGEVYGRNVDAKAHNAYYERPATLSLLPPLTGLRVLDIGCGNGWYAEYLLAQGASVTAFDASPVMVEQTRRRMGERARVFVADFSEPFTWAENGAFDLVVAPLVLHYVKNWQPVFAELHRVLRPSGLLVFSTHHPAAEYIRHQPENYFTTEQISEDWNVGRVTFYRRPLTAAVDALTSSGFVIERILEPLPTSDFASHAPEVYARLLRFPDFILFRARAERLIPDGK